MGKKLPLRSITGTKFYTHVIKEGRTIESFLEMYDAPREQVLALAKKRVGSNNWGQILAADKRNARKTKRKEEHEKNSEKNNNEESSDVISLAKLKESYSLVSEQLENFSHMAEASRTIIYEAEATIAEAKAKIAGEEEELEKFLGKIKALESEQDDLQRRINEVEKTILIAPGYKGQLPNNGSRMVSTIQYADGVLVEQGIELLKEPSFTEALSFGFGDLKEIAMALDFAKLVIYYWLANDDKPFEVLADPNTWKVLKIQGYEKP